MIVPVDSFCRWLAFDSADLTSLLAVAACSVIMRCPFFRDAMLSNLEPRRTLIKRPLLIWVVLLGALQVHDEERDSSSSLGIAA